MSVEQIVREEIERSKNVHGEDDCVNPWYNHYFNNFYLKFFPLERTCCRSFWDVPLKVSLPNLKECSKLYYGQSPHEFYETIDRTVEETGISLDEVTCLVKRRPEDEDVVAFNRWHKKFCDLILPAYIRLREIGYNQQDLTGWTCCVKGH